MLEKSAYHSTDSGKVPPRSKAFSLDSLKELRRRYLRDFYNFDEFDLAIFASRKQPVIDNPEMEKEIENILKTKIPKENISEFTDLGNRYFRKLLKPMEKVAPDELFPVLEALKPVLKSIDIRTIAVAPPSEGSWQNLVSSVYLTEKPWR